MAKMFRSVTELLSGKRIAVAGVSRSSSQAANAVFRKLRDSGYEAIPINPRASEVEGERCYSDLASVPGSVDGVVVATHPDVAIELVRQMRGTWRRTNLVSPLVRRRQRVGRRRSPVRAVGYRLHRRRLPAHVLRTRGPRTSVHEVVAPAAGSRAEVGAGHPEGDGWH